MIEIAEARYSENDTKCGKGGDQTGREVWIKELMPENVFTWILRCADERRRNIALAAWQAARNDAIGYSQATSGSVKETRYGLWSEMDSGLTIPEAGKVNVDCSSLVTCCCRAAGIPTPKTVTTRNMISMFNSTGAFEVIPYDMDELEPGDIVLRDGHCAIVTDVIRTAEPEGHQEFDVYYKLTIENGRYFFTPV